MRTSLNLRVRGAIYPGLAGAGLFGLLPSADTSSDH
jgi:hypothetical protein